MRNNITSFLCRKNLEGGCYCGSAVMGTQTLPSLCSTIKDARLPSLRWLQDPRRLLELQSVYLSSRRQEGEQVEAGLFPYFCVLFKKLFHKSFSVTYIGWNWNTWPQQGRVWSVVFWLHILSTPVLEELCWWERKELSVTPTSRVDAQPLSPPACWGRVVLKCLSRIVPDSL